MPDMSAFDAENTPVYNRRKIDIIIDELEAAHPDRMEALQTALQDRSYNSAAIARVLRSWGHKISSDAVQNYRTGR